MSMIVASGDTFRASKWLKWSLIAAFALLSSEPAFALWIANRSLDPPLLWPAVFSSIPGAVIGTAVVVVSRNRADRVLGGFFLGEMLVVLFWRWLEFRAWLGSISMCLFVMSLLILVAYVVERYLPPWIAVVGGVAVWCGVVVPTTIGILLVPPSPVLPGAVPGPVNMRESLPRDVVVVVLDEHARGDIMRSSFDNSYSFDSELVERGFHVATRSTANYSMTYASLASFLDASYPLHVGQRLTRSYEWRLRRMISGENAAVRWFKANGYRYVHIEGSLLSRCGDETDECHHLPLYEETMHELWEGTPIGGVINEVVGPHPSNTVLHGLDRLDAVVAASSTRPRFVFAHVLAPHPPLYLRSNCEIRSTPTVDSTVLVPEGALRLDDRGREAYADQAACVDSRILHAIQASSARAIWVIVSDHGPAASGQFYLARDAWTSGQLRERLSNLIAIRLPRGCGSPPQDLSLVEVFPVVTGCLSTHPVPAVASHYLLAPVGVTDPSPAVAAFRQGERWDS